MAADFKGYQPPPATGKRRTLPTFEDWASDKRRGTIQVLPRSPEPRPRATPVPETDRNWRPREMPF